MTTSVTTQVVPGQVISEKTVAPVEIEPEPTKPAEPVKKGDVVYSEPTVKK